MSKQLCCMFNIVYTQHWKHRHSWAPYWNRFLSNLLPFCQKWIILFHFIFMKYPVWEIALRVHNIFVAFFILLGCRLYIPEMLWCRRPSSLLTKLTWLLPKMSCSYFSLYRKLPMEGLGSIDQICLGSVPPFIFLHAIMECVLDWLCGAFGFLRCQIQGANNYFHDCSCAPPPPQS